MSETDTNPLEAEAPANAYNPPDVLNIPISKVKIDGKVHTIPVKYQLIPDHVMVLVIAEGLKTLLNSKQSKLSTAKLEGQKLEDMQLLVLEQAEKNLAAIMGGSFVKGRPGANTDETGTKIPGPVVAEARRLARNDVKAALKAANMKISQVKASDITSAANELIAKDPNYYITAKSNLETRAATPIAKDIASLIKVSPELVKKADEEKAQRKLQLSAKQAGKPAARVPPAKGTGVPPGIAQAQGRVPQAQTAH